MRESDFWDAYRDSQDSITVSDDMKRTITDRARHESANHASSAADGYRAACTAQGAHRRSAVSPGGSQRPTDKRPRKLGRIVAPIAACAVLVAILVGVLGFPSGNAGGNAGPADFAVKAYAAATDSILAMGNENQIIFGRDANINGVADQGAYLTTEGCYTGCMFRVEGEGITRIQASVSTGVIYRYTTEKLTRGNDLDRMHEVLGWKPAARGLGEYYGGYDDVKLVSMAGTPDVPKDDPDKQQIVGLSKKLGSTIDVPVDENTAEQSFGFWTNEDYGGAGDGFSDLDAIIDLFDGAELTITVTFGDGHTTTQVIELHAADVKASMQTDAEGAAVFILTPEIVDPTGLEKYTEYIHTLYGEIKETNHNAFPGSLDNANEFENVVSDPQSFDRQPLTTPIDILSDGKTVKATIDPANIHPATDSLPMTSETGKSFSVSNVSILSRSQELPEGITLDDLESGFGTWEYFNRVVSQIDGYELDGSGTPSTGFSWVMMQADVTNTGNLRSDLTADGRFYGTIAIYDDQKVVSRTLARSFKLLNGGWDTSLAAGEHGGDMGLEPGESRTVRWLAIVPDVVLDNSSMFFLPGYDTPLQGLALPLPN